jgi:hypothetical protein
MWPFSESNAAAMRMLSDCAATLSIGRAPERRDQDQRLHRRLPFRGLMFGLGELRDVATGILDGDKLALKRGKSIDFAGYIMRPI